LSNRIGPAHPRKKSGGRGLRKSRGTTITEGTSITIMKRLGRKGGNRKNELAQYQPRPAL